MNPLLIYEATTEEPYPDVQAWCMKYVGDWNEDWWRECHDIAAVIVSGSYKQRYFFKNEKDCTMFMLRWG